MSATTDVAGASTTARMTPSGIWVDERGTGEPVLLIAGLGDPAEAWELQLADLGATHRVVAFDNRGVGRSALPSAGLTMASMADDAATVLDELGIADAHVVGFSGGSAIAQELALRHPTRVDSLTLIGTWARADRHFDAAVDAWTWMAERAPSGRAFFEAFFVWVYSARAHESGLVEMLIDEALAFPHPQSSESFVAQLAAFRRHDTLDRLHTIEVPTLVIAGGQDLICPPRLGRVVAEAITGARFVVLEEEAHQPFQESPEAFDALVREFWRSIES
ncbi:MAG: alpha/beta fold hydrolase [Ilumatobacteraceae bacterium]